MFLVRWERRKFRQGQGARTSIVASCAPFAGIFKGAAKYLATPTYGASFLPKTIGKTQSD
jgi:hypothetical protein